MGAGRNVRAGSGWVNRRAQEILPFDGCDLRRDDAFRFVHGHHRLHQRRVLNAAASTKGDDACKEPITCKSSLTIQRRCSELSDEPDVYVTRQRSIGLRELDGINNAFRELEATPGELKEKASLDPRAELNRRGRSLRVVFGRNAMATTSFTALRRFAGYAFTLMLISLCLTGLAAGQGIAAGDRQFCRRLEPPHWVGDHPGVGDRPGWRLVCGGLCQRRAVRVSCGRRSGDCAWFRKPSASLGGGYQNPVIAIDPGNNLYLGANWNNCLLMFPWNATTKTWTGLNDGGPNDLSPSNPTTTMCTNSGNNNEPEAFAQYGVTDLIGQWHWLLSAVGSCHRQQQRPDRRRTRRLPRRSYYDVCPSRAHGPLLYTAIGLRAGAGTVRARDCRCAWTRRIIFSLSRIPADSPVCLKSRQAQPLHLHQTPALPRVDPMLPAVKGVITDAAGNLYISDSQTGVVEVPNPSGTPQTSSAILLTGVPAGGQVAVDAAHNVMYVPTSQIAT